MIQTGLRIVRFHIRAIVVTTLSSTSWALYFMVEYSLANRFIPCGKRRVDIVIEIPIKIFAIDHWNIKKFAVAILYSKPHGLVMCVGVGIGSFKRWIGWLCRETSSEGSR